MASRPVGLLSLLGVMLLGPVPFAAGMWRPGQRRRPLPPLPGAVWRQLPDAIDRLLEEPQHGGVCLQTFGDFPGRFSNAVRVLNSIMEFALAKGIPLQAPERLNDDTSQEGFDGIFGVDPSCPPHPVLEYRAVSRADCRPEALMAKGHSCSPEEMELDMAAWERSSSTSCGCGRVVLVDASNTHVLNSYAATHSAFRHRYWEARKSATPPPGGDGRQSVRALPARVVMHMRLGDIEYGCVERYGPTSNNCFKRLPPEPYLTTLRSLAAVLDPACMELNLATDGHLNSPDVQSVVAGVAEYGIRKPTVWTSDRLDAARTMDLLAAADILIFGFSGFGQLASVLSKTENARIGTPLPYKVSNAHWEYAYLPNTTQLRWEWMPHGTDMEHWFNDSQANEMLKANPAIEAIVNECSRQQARVDS